jgi:hypothetical protein
VSTFKDIEQRLRAARPEIEASPPPFTALVARIEQATDATRPKPRRWWQRSRTAIPVALAAVVLAGAGGSALLLTEGKPLPPAFVLPANPNTGLGEPVAASLALLPMRVADPEGGPPWGMRVIQTTRGLVCLQGGRVVNGQLGGLGTAYAFNADGHFHPFLPADAIGIDGCVTGDEHGLAFMPGGPEIVTADGLPLAGENLWPGERVHCDLPGQDNWGVRCPQDELRQVAMGVLGPDAASINVSTSGRAFTVQPYGPEGAYLIVLPAQADANASMPSGSAGTEGSTSNAPGGAVLTVTYRDGSQCEIPAEQECPREGFDFPSSALPSSAEVSAPIAVHYLPSVTHPSAPLIAWARTSDPDRRTAFPGNNRTGPNGIGEELPGSALAVSFEARVSAKNESSGYVVQLVPQEVAGCATPGLIVSQPTEQTISAGQHVEMTVPLEDRCATSYSGTVFYAKSVSQSEPGVSRGEGEGPLYEVIASQFGVRLRPRSRQFPTVGSFNISVP